MEEYYCNCCNYKTYDINKFNNHLTSSNHHITVNIVRN